MTKQEIITLAESMGFILNYDKYDDKEYPGDSHGFKFLRFVHPDKELDEPDLRWIWYKEDGDEDNRWRGVHIWNRIQRKIEVLNSLKY